LAGEERVLRGNLQILTYWEIATAFQQGAKQEVKSLAMTGTSIATAFQQGAKQEVKSLAMTGTS
jgi:hypothetical protein